jgi:hypothetical protein
MRLLILTLLICIGSQSYGYDFPDIKFPYKYILSMYLGTNTNITIIKNEPREFEFLWEGKTNNFWLEKSGWVLVTLNGKTIKVYEIDIKRYRWCRLSSF